LDASDPLFDPVTSQQGNRRERGPARRDLWKEAELGKSSANMLIDALGFTPIEDLDSNELIKVGTSSSSLAVLTFEQEFYGNCQRSQSIFIDAIPHAAQKAEAAAQQHQPLPDGRPAIDEHQPTNEATLYQKLLDANQTLTEAFKMYDGAFRIGTSPSISLQAQIASGGSVKRKKRRWFRNAQRLTLEWYASPLNRHAF
jgi:hypothetical protein